MGEATQTLGLYLSVPFCRAKCSFCNFASGVGSAEAVERYVEQLCAEVRGVRRAAAALGVAVPEAVDTVYLGGGTPSLLEPGQMERLFGAIRGEFAVEAGAETTLEAAPGQIGDALLDAALRLGINRVSLGVQSFADREAQAVGRSHTEANCRAELARLRGAGVPNLGVDLIAGLPYQTEASWEHSLDVAVASGLQHVSVYMLEVDAESRLGREVLGGGARLHAPAVPGDDLMAALYERACERLPEAGFGQYEISNFAAEGWRSRHNLKYWTRAPYLGLGLDAHSMLLGENGRAVRWANAEELAEYEGRAGVADAGWVSEREAFEEMVFLGLRLTAGLPRTALARFRADWVRDVEAGLRMLASEALVAAAEDGWRLTGRGRLLSSEVFGELLAGVPA